MIRLEDLARTWALLKALPVNLAEIRAALRNLESRVDAHCTAPGMHSEPGRYVSRECPQCHRATTVLALERVPSPDKRHLFDLHRCTRCGLSWCETRKELQS